MNGTGVSPGISIGTAWVVKKDIRTRTGILLQNEEDILREMEKYKRAVKTSAEELQAVILHAESSEAADILEMQIELLNDPQMERDVFDKITAGKKNAHDALMEVVEILTARFWNMSDAYLKARASDIQDSGNRILNNLGGLQKATPPSFRTNTIVVAEDLSPADTITLDIKNVIGFITREGGKTSHAAIIARSRGIPAVVGCGEAWHGIKDGDQVLMDGETGLVIPNPEQEQISAYVLKRQSFMEKLNLLKKLKHAPSVTTDGWEIKLFANIADADDLETVFDQGGEGVGLFRTELLFLGRESMPTEEEQFALYKNVAIKSKGKSVTVRTLDIGGDKQLSYFDIPAEQNPFLGYRAIRICLDKKDIFVTQLKAILRASSFGKFSIMFPMISGIREIRQAKEILAGAKNELREAQIPFDENIPVGIMMEIPSAAITADLLASEVDFFSIGTNDLCQYSLAVDRMNEKVKELYDPYNPGVLRLIRFIIEQGHKHKIRVGMCGELASDPLATLLLMGLGLKEFSMNAGAIPIIKDIIVHHDLEKAKAIGEAVMQMEDSAKIMRYLQTMNT